ncbi:MAG: AraC family transcriptional regulator [Eubacterium sp.]|nr:AraC family transcriptional regulator [Eubacterium sp.]
MDWAVGIQNAVDYIEAHITEELDFEEIAKRAASSSFYFQRIFGALCGYSLGEYIRNRRLTLAGIELSAKNSKVIDIALKYGYDSPESFARAFSKFHGITPSQAKKDGSQLRSFSKLYVNISLKGGSTMNYKIIEKEAFTVLEKVSVQDIDDSKNKNTIPDFWTASHNDGTVKTLLELTNDKTYIFGICYGNIPKDKKTFEYSIAAPCDKDCAVPEGFRLNTVPARTWAVFESIGELPKSVQETWHRIISEFFPSSLYEPTYEMDIEAYPSLDMNASDYRCEIWVPVTKRNSD